MKITVLGAGVIGMASAYFLQRSGHSVTIVDKQNGSGEECSFSNGAQLSYCAAQPWANFGALKKGLKWLGKEDAPLRFRFLPDIKFWLWMAQFVLNCNKNSEARNTKNILDLCLYSRSVLHQYENEFDFDFDYTKGGKIFIFNKQSDYDGYLSQCRLQEIMGAPYQVLSRDEVFNYEPSLEHMSKELVGFVRDPWDEAGDTYKFCLGLEAKLKAMGAEFKYNHEIKRLNQHGGRITSVTTDKGELTSDAFVLCLGSNSNLLSAAAGVRLPVYPIKGYSITVTGGDERTSVNNSVTNYGQRTVFSKLGNKMRVAGTAEFAGYDTSLNQSRIKMLKDLTAKMFPYIRDVETAEEWACLRPCTPSGVPILGKSKVENLFLNVGQGSLGWTMAFASAKMVADIINGKQTEIDIDPFKL